MPVQLLVTNIGFALSIILSFSLCALTFIKRPKENPLPSILFSLLIISFVIWQISYIIGINLHDPAASRFAFMFNMLAVFIPLVNVHFSLAVTNGLTPTTKKVMTYLYTIASAFVAFYLIFPHTFMELSRPKLYLPNFFVPGSLYSLQDAFFMVLVIYNFATFGIGYRKGDYAARSKLKYYILAMLWVYGFALIPEFLLYDIPVDPMLAPLCGLFVIPMAYAILKYEVLDLSIVAKRAVGYALSVTGVTLVVLAIGYANDAVVRIIPEFPRWLLPFISALLAVLIGVVVWRKIKEVEALKYQFITVVTHKFRTPLTHIRWSVENLKENSDPTEQVKSVDAISEAYDKLYKLTDVLVGLSASDDSQFLYKYEKNNVGELVNETIKTVNSRVRDHQISIENNVSTDLPSVFIDREKLGIALQTVLENALVYSASGNKVIISALSSKDSVTISVKDFGIGIPPQEMPRIFSKFFRASNALRADTEGLGIGMYLSRDILKRNGGDLWAESEGEGKGSTFFLKMPIAKK